MSQSAFDKGQKQYPFTRKHAKIHRYHISGPPRDIAGALHEPKINDPFQQHKINKNAQRDHDKFIGSKDFKVEENHELPPEPKIRDEDYESYLIEAFEAGRLGKHGIAYWLYMAAGKAAPSLLKRGQCEEYAKANLKSWQQFSSTRENLMGA